MLFKNGHDEKLFSKWIESIKFMVRFVLFLPSLVSSFVRVEGRVKNSRIFANGY